MSSGVETIAILDDDDDLRELLAEMFESLISARCLTAATLAELIERSPEFLRSQLAVLDINLGPGRPTGFDAYQWLVANQYSGRVVFLTGHALNDPLMHQARALGKVEVLGKPVTVERMLQLVSPRGAG